MKLTKRTSKHFVLFLALGIIAGTLLWEIVERFIALSGSSFSLTAGPIGFDVDVLEIWLSVNPGSLIGGIGGYLLFRRI